MSTNTSKTHANAGFWLPKEMCTRITEHAEKIGVAKSRVVEQAVARYLASSDVKAIEELMALK